MVAVGATDQDGVVSTPLTAFSPQTRQWFEAVFAAPTPAQDAAWQAISAGQTRWSSPRPVRARPSLHSSGRSIAAEHPSRRRGTTVLYISPLKALAVDVERNLRAPLAGIRNATADGLTPPDITVAIRTGDTPAPNGSVAPAPEHAPHHHPGVAVPDAHLRGPRDAASVTTVIVDEVHAVAGTKRGAHLALSLERLDALLPAPAQRIGLSATVRPPTRSRRSWAGLTGRRWSSPRAQRVRCPSWCRSKTSTTSGTRCPSTPRAVSRAVPSLWPHVESRIVDLVTAHRSTIVFANSRRLTERLAARLNEEAARRAGVEPGSTRTAPAEVMAQAGSTLRSRSAPGDRARPPRLGLPRAAHRHREH